MASGTFAARPLMQGHAGPITRVAASRAAQDGAGGGLFATGSSDGSARLWSARHGGLLGVVAEGPAAGPVLSLAVGPLAGGGPGGANQVGLVVTGWGDGALRAHALPPPGAAAQPQGAAGPQPMLPRAWVLPGAHALAHSCGVGALALAHRGHFVASGGAGGEVIAVGAAAVHEGMA